MTRPQTIPAKRWLVAPPTPASLRQQLPGINPVLLQVLYNRGLTDPADIQAFLQKRYQPSTDPFLLAGMEIAVERIKHAILNEERIAVYGDFDADGVTATVLLIKALRALGLPARNARPYIPDRVDEGYGLNVEALTSLKNDHDIDVVITVDCGIRSVAEVEHARAIGLDLIVTDHHSLGKRLPPALAVINPKREDSSYPERMLAGVGIAYKLAEALFQALPDRAHNDVRELLDLVALGTVADLAPLLGENRRLVVDGLAVLNQARRPGVAALLRVAGLQPGKITAESIAFALGPRLNAAGRLGSAYTAARMLAVNDSREAERLAQKLDELNRRRQKVTRELSREAEQHVEIESPLLFVAGEQFSPGIVGLVASRLAERYYRPAVVIEKGASESRGSCRSIDEFHITDALDEVSDLLEHYGGHAQAAGLTIRNEQLPQLKQRLVALAHEKLGGLDLRPTIAVDAELSLHAIDWALHGQMQQLEPTGYANPMPVFVSRGVEVIGSRAVGQEKSHLQLHVTDGTLSFKGIAFRQGAWAGCLPTHIDIAYSLSVNEWRGRQNLELTVQDIQEAA